MNYYYGSGYDFIGWCAGEGGRYRGVLISYFDSIEEMLQEKVDCPILSIGDIIKEM